MSSQEVSLIPTVTVTIVGGAVAAEAQSFSFCDDSSICKSDKSDSCKVKWSHLFSSPKMIVFYDISCLDVVLLLSSTAICTGDLSLSVQLGIPSKQLPTSLELSSTFKGHNLVSGMKDNLSSTVLIKLVKLSIVSFSSGQCTLVALFSIKGIPCCSKIIAFLLHFFFLLLDNALFRLRLLFL